MMELSPQSIDLIEISILSLAMIFVAMMLSHGLSRLVDRLIEWIFTE